MLATYDNAFFTRSALVAFTLFPSQQPFLCFASLCCFQRRRRRDSLEKNSRSDESGEMKRAVDSGFTNKIHLQAVKVWQLWQHKLLLCVFTSPSIQIQHGLWSLPDTRSLARRWAQKAGKFTSDKMFWLWMSDAGTYKAGWTYWD